MQVPQKMSLTAKIRRSPQNIPENDQNDHIK
jgi:hypothetical protein